MLNSRSPETEYSTARRSVAGVFEVLRVDKIGVKETEEGEESGVDGQVFEKESLVGVDELEGGEGLKGPV